MAANSALSDADLCKDQTGDCPTKCTSLFQQVPTDCLGKNWGTKPFDYASFTNLMELGLNGKGSCAFAPTKTMLANSKLDCSSVMALAVGQGSYTSCGEDTNKCSQTCKDTIDKVYSVCKTSDAKWELAGTELTVSTGVMSARVNYGDECDAYEDTKEWYKAPAPSTETVDSGAPASSAVLGVAAAAVASVAAMIF